MEPFIVVAVAVVVAGSLFHRFFLHGLRSERETGAVIAAWKEAARACRLTDVAFESSSLTGRSEALLVHLGFSSGGEADGTRIRISGLLPGLTVRPQGLGHALSHFRGVTEVVLGDEDFDEIAWVRGDPVQVRALLDYECRQALGALFDGHLLHAGASTLWVTGHVDDGVLILDAPNSLATRRSVQDDPVHFTSLHHMPQILQAGLDLGRRLLPLDEPALRLTENMANEPMAEVRCRTLDVLTEQFPRHSATREALVAAGKDSSAALRFKAAVALGGRRGRDVLVDLALGHGADDETTARAVEALGRSLTTPEAEKVLGEALRTRREATAHACMKALGRRGTPEATPILTRVLTVEKGPLAHAAAVALGTNGDPGAEGALLRALEEGSAGLQSAAAWALGRVGTAAAVSPLKRAETRSGNLRPLARQAVAEIQARLAGGAGAAAGQLSLSSGESGQLSLTDDASGRVSLPEPSSTGGNDETEG